MNRRTEERIRRQYSNSLTSYNSRRKQLCALMEQLPSTYPNSNAVGEDEFQPLKTQVAGHRVADGKETICMLKCNKDGTVLKPVTKKEVGMREIRFYEQLQSTTDGILMEMKDFCVNYYGTRVLDIGGETIEFLILEDMTEKMAQPCIMDLKIGKITWDPLASDEKIAKEKEKYGACKRDVGFCIPGFQVYKLPNGILEKYDKNFGKMLNGITIRDALKIFLNANNGVMCRELIVKLLSRLWQIQKWAKKQKSIRLYSTSLLIAYDYNKLKKIVEETSPQVLQRKLSTPRVRKTSFNLPETYSKDSTGHFSGQLASTGPILNQPSTSQQSLVFSNSTREETASNWHRAVQKVTRSLSFHHNYNDFISNVKMDYTTTLKEVLGDDKDNKKPWFDVRIIDFAHTFPAEEQTLDMNYIEGIDNLVQIFESFLDNAI